MKVKAFLFDLDGTLVDTEALWTRAIVDFVYARGGETSFEQILPMVLGHSWIDIDNLLHARFPELGDSTPMEDAVELRSYYERYATDPEAMIIRPSIEFLKRVSEFAIVAIVSGSPHEDILNAARLCGIESNIKLVLGAGEYKAGKPSPSGYLKAAELLGLAPKDCVVVEDSAVGVAAGVAAGMPTIALDRSVLVKQHYEGETWRVSSLGDLDIVKEFT